MRYIYPAVFRREKEYGFTVFFPDIPESEREADSLEDCFAVAEKFLTLELYTLEEEKKSIPPGSLRYKSASDEDFVTFICVETENYRRTYENRLIKKTLSIPAWLNKRAEDANINFSRLLVKALKEELQIVTE